MNASGNIVDNVNDIPVKQISKNEKQPFDMFKVEILFKFFCSLKVLWKVVDVNIKVGAKLVEEAVVEVVRFFPQAVFLQVKG